MLNSKFFPIVIIVLVALAQQARLFDFWGVNPNLTLLALTIFAFMALSPGVFFSCAILGAIFLKTAPGFESGSAAILALAGIIWIFGRTNPWHPHFAVLFGTVLATTVFYLIVDFGFITERTYLFGQELVYNLIITIIVWFSIHYFNYETAR